MFSADLREGVANGTVTVSIRLWARPKVKDGGRYTTAGVVIEVDSVELLPFSAVTAADVRRSGEPDREALRDRAAHAGPIDDDTLVHRVEFHVVQRSRGTGQDRRSTRPGAAPTVIPRESPQPGATTERKPER